MHGISQKLSDFVMGEHESRFIRLFKPKEKTNDSALQEDWQPE